MVAADILLEASCLFLDIKFLAGPTTGLLTILVGASGPSPSTTFTSAYSISARNTKLSAHDTGNYEGNQFRFQMTSTKNHQLNAISLHILGIN